MRHRTDRVRRSAAEPAIVGPMADRPAAGGALAAYEALLFDLDGVITKTAAVHAEAWKALFDEFLRQWADQHGEAFRPFEVPADYVRYVDGKRRYDGVASFLGSRGIDLPRGEPGDGPDERTVCGLGNRKDGYFIEAVAERGVEVFDDTVTLIDAARRVGKRLAVVSASEHCESVLARVGLLDRFEVKVTGKEASAWGLPGKPAPDTFLKAAELLGVPPGRAVVFEDAIAGVQAGRAGGFGLVVGVNRGEAAEALAANGADLVVSDLRQLAPT
jgi:alpha,alpha-trehalase